MMAGGQRLSSKIRVDAAKYERIERVIVEHTSDNAARSLSDDTVRNEATTKAASDEQPTHRYWSA
jgi:hypothetical protein